MINKVDSMKIENLLEIHNGALNSDEILQKWCAFGAERGFGANCFFVGIVRDELPKEFLENQNLPLIESSTKDLIKNDSIKKDIESKTNLIESANKAQTSNSAIFGGLSFEIYEPLLRSWFSAWQKKAQERGAFLAMAHSRGLVLPGKCSYISAVFSPQRAAALGLFADFVEDFKHNAPIWKYDVINNEKFYAANRSHKLNHAGLLSDKN